MSTVYISGPITAKKDYKKVFEEAEKALKKPSNKVVNPAALIDPRLPWTSCMKQAICLLMTCDAICKLPGWEHSRGACIEASIADALGYENIKLPEGKGDN